MATFDFSDYFFYKWRYVIGYTAVGLLLAGVLLFAGLYVPGGLSEAEMASVIQSQQVSYDNLGTLAIINLPYHMLQDGLLHLFGPSIFVIKLPSLILALLSALGLIALLRRWFKPNIAVLASLIAISTGQFLFVAQQGTPDILYIFWPVTILLLGTQVTRATTHRALWKSLFAAVVALSLYTPLSAYTVIAVILTIVLHPHLRAIIRRLSRKRIIISLGIALILLIPFAAALFRTPGVIGELLGIPSVWPSFIENVTTVLKQYFLFWNPGATTLLTPVFSLGSFLLIALGFYRLILTRDTTRSYLILIWLGFMTPVLIINPTLTSVTFTIAVFLLAAGLTSLIDYWYRLFPRNPYARVSGLVPIIILVVALIGSGITRYVYGYHYSPPAAALFSTDLRLIPDEARELMVSDAQKPFYKAALSYQDVIKLVTQPSQNTVIATRDVSAPKNYSIQRIITNDRAANADRFYVYTKNTD